MSSVRHILAAFVALAVVASCSDRPKVIPEKKLELIYEDMFVADQWLRDHSEFADEADTTLFFDPIFARYGYDFEDYDATLKYYTARPDVFSELMTRVSDRLAAKSTEYTNLGNEYAETARANRLNRVGYIPWKFDPVSLPLDFMELHDSLRDVEVLRDSLRMISDLARGASDEGPVPAGDGVKLRTLRQIDSLKLQTVSRAGAEFIKKDDNQ